MEEIIWDHRPLYVFNQTEEETYRIIEKRYSDFISVLSDPSKEPISVFDPLKPKLFEELNMIREVSKELQIKKDEDIRKSQAADTEEEKKEEVKEEEKPEVTEKTDA
ncbi:hypothetical protein ABMA27_011285 [Loxostege sticticalis]